MYFYNLFGVSVSCPFRLEFVSSISGRNNCDIVALLGSTPSALHPSTANVKYCYSDDGLTIGFPKIGSYFVQNGNKIVVSPLDIDKIHECGLPLTGIVMAMALEQRGSFVLHASGINIGNKAVLFLGDKYFGKSTISAFMHFHVGCPLITDDIAVLNLSNGTFCLQVGLQSFKLWPDSLDYLKKKPSQLAKVHQLFEKRILPVETSDQLTAVELSAIFVLGKGEQIEITRLSQSESCLTLLKFRSGSFFTRGMPPFLRESNFKQSAKIAASIPVYKLNRPEDLLLLPETCARILDGHFL